MDGRTFFAEDKLDGIRARCTSRRATRVAIYTRTMDRTDESFPDVVEAIRKLPGDFLLDGEIVPYRDGAVLPFAHIQKRLGRKVLTPKIIRDNPAVFIAFDILYRDGELLMDQPLRERRAALEDLTSSAQRRGAASGCASGIAALKYDGNARTRGGAAGSRSAGTATLLITTITPVTTAEEIDSCFCHRPRLPQRRARPERPGVALLARPARADVAEDSRRTCRRSTASSPPRSTGTASGATR